MKQLILPFLLFISTISFAQQLTSAIKSSFKYDDFEALNAELNSQRLTIGDCFDIEGASYSLLALSVRMEKPKIFNALINKKANLNKVCNDKTPLMYAAKYGKLEMAKLLINAGANQNLKNNDGETASDYAVKYKMKDLETYFLSLKTANK